MTNPRILIIDGNAADVRARQHVALGYDSGDGYARVLKSLLPGVLCDVIRPADGPAPLPAGVSLEQYDGATMTGSALNIYNGGDAVQRQMDAARAVFAAGIPFFGSCWGLQVAVTVAGGKVRANPRGREYGFARRILLNKLGREHPMYAGKPQVFEAPTIHRDEVSELPVGATILATNEMGIQAATFSHLRGTFWGVQYHPEYDCRDIAAAGERYGMTLVNEGLFSDEAALRSYLSDLRQLHEHPGDAPLAWKYGLGTAITDPALRRAEIKNWLDGQVLPRVRLVH